MATGCDTKLKAQAPQAFKGPFEMQGMSLASKKGHRSVNASGKHIKVGLGLVLGISSIAMGYHSLVAWIQQTVIHPVERIAALTTTATNSWIMP